MDIIFYSVLTTEYLIYLKFRRNNNIPFFCLGNVLVILTYIFVVIPGYINYRGGVLIESYGQINQLVYIIFFLQAFLTPIVTTVAWKLSLPFKVSLKPRKNYRNIFFFFVIIVLFYDVFYVINFFDNLPVSHAILGNLDSANFSRAMLTHGISNSEMPLFAAYGKLFTKDLSFFLFFPFIILLKKPFNLIALLLLIYLLLMHNEKSYLIFLILGLFMVRNNIETIKKSKIIKLGLLIAAASFILIYSLFANDLIDSADYIIDRLAAQAGYVYAQIDMMSNYGLLGINGLYLGFIGRIFDIEFINISKLTFDLVHSKVGLEGSSAGIALADIFFVFGYASFAIYPFLLMIIILLDKFIYRTFFSNIDNTALSLLIKKTFYIYFVTFYSLAVMGSIFNLISFVTLFQIPFLIILFILLSIFKFRITYIKGN